MDQGYFDELKKRAKESHVYKKYQLLGLEIAEALGDDKHKALYIKFAKENNPEELLALAKRVAENSTVKNKGAYFMKIVTEERKSRRSDVKSEVRDPDSKTSGKRVNGRKSSDDSK